MEFYSDKLKDAREFAGMSQADLAEKIGVSKQAVQKWEAGEASPRPSRAKAIMRILNAEIASFGDTVVKPITDMHRVPVFGMAAAAEIGNSNMPLADYAEQNADDYTYFPDAKQGDFSLVASGDSMAPWYPNGTRLLVRPTQRPHDGERVVAVLADGDVVFKIFVEGRDTYALTSINSSGRTFVFDKCNFNAIKALYSVVASYRIEADLDAAMGTAGIRHYWEKVKEGLE